MQLLPTSEFLDTSSANVYLMPGPLPDSLDGYDQNFLLDNCLKASSYTRTLQSSPPRTKQLADLRSVNRKILTPTQFKDVSSGRIYPKVNVFSTTSGTVIDPSDRFMFNAFARALPSLNSVTADGGERATSTYTNLVVEYDFGEAVTINRVEIGPYSRTPFNIGFGVSLVPPSVAYSDGNGANFTSMASVNTVNSDAKVPFAISTSTITTRRVQITLNKASSPYITSLIFYGSYVSGKTSLNTIPSARHIVVETGGAAKVYGLNTTQDFTKIKDADLFLATPAVDAQPFYFPVLYLTNNIFTG